MTPRDKKRRPRNKADEVEDARRPLWSGSISFGLLQIPVSLFTAEQGNEVAFHQLDRRDLSPIRYERVNSATGKPVAWHDIVRGYEHTPGEYVVINSADLDAISVSGTQTIDLADFVNVTEIPPTFFLRPYYVAPGRRAEKVYALFRDALEHKKVAAIGLVVIRTRQHLCAILAEKGVLVLELLRFADELRGTEGIPVPRGPAQVGARERSMAEELIESMRAPWDPTRYKDRYRQELTSLVARKAAGGEVQAPIRRAARPGNVVDVIALLEKSIRARSPDGQRALKKQAAPSRGKGAKPSGRRTEAA